MPSFLGRIAPSASSKVNLFLDLVLVALCIPGAAVLAGRAAAFDATAVAWFTASALAVWVVTSTALRHYDPGVERSALDDLGMITVLVAAVATPLTIVLAAVPADVPMPRVGHFFLLAWTSAVLVRLACTHLPRGRVDPDDQVLVVGTGPLARETAGQLDRGRYRRRILGFLPFSTDLVPRELVSRCLCPADDIESCLETFPVSEVYVAGDPTRHAREMHRVVHACETLGVPFALPVFGFRLDRALPADPRSVRDGYLHYQLVPSKPAQRALKRLIDVVVSAVALWLLLPILGAAVLAVKLTSKGPVLFRQQRAGLHGRRFNMLKLRSMVADAEEMKAALATANEQAGPVFKIRRDPRITPVGRFLRRYSIDELPQLVNVLRGDMSLVGPRPPVPGEVERYQAWQRRRLSVRPGLTCIWQVSGRNEISFEDWMYLDMRYIDNWSLGADLGLILKTFPVVLTGRGAS